jgi:hypothetical protein
MGILKSILRELHMETKESEQRRKFNCEQLEYRKRLRVLIYNHNFRKLFKANKRK